MLTIFVFVQNQLFAKILLWRPAQLSFKRMLKMANFRCFYVLDRIIYINWLRLYAYYLYRSIFVNLPLEFAIILLFQHIIIFYNLCVAHIWPFPSQTFLYSYLRCCFQQLMNNLLGPSSLYGLFRYLVFETFLRIFHI